MQINHKSFIIIAIIAIISMILAIVALSHSIDLPFTNGTTLTYSVKDIYHALDGPEEVPFFRNFALQIGMAYIGSILVIIFSGIILAGIAGMFAFNSHISDERLWYVLMGLFVIMLVILIVAIIALVDAKHITSMEWLNNHIPSQIIIK